MRAVGIVQPNHNRLLGGTDQLKLRWQICILVLALADAALHAFLLVHLQDVVEQLVVIAVGREELHEASCVDIKSRVVLVLFLQSTLVVGLQAVQFANCPCAGG